MKTLKIPSFYPDLQSLIKNENSVKTLRNNLHSFKGTFIPQYQQYLCEILYKNRIIVTFKQQMETILTRFLSCCINWFYDSVGKYSGKQEQEGDPGQSQYFRQLRDGLVQSREVYNWPNIEVWIKSIRHA